MLDRGRFYATGESKKDIIRLVEAVVRLKDDYDDAVKLAEELTEDLEETQTLLESAQKELEDYECDCK